MTNQGFDILVKKHFGPVTIFACDINFAPFQHKLPELVCWKLCQGVGAFVAAALAAKADAFGGVEL